MKKLIIVILALLLVGCATTNSTFTKSSDGAISVVNGNLSIDLNGQLTFVASQSNNQFPLSFITSIIQQILGNATVEQIAPGKFKIVPKGGI